MDIDVLVAPGDVGQVTGRLGELGWTSLDEADEAILFPLHSVTYRHEAWPCTIDLHHEFPGFFADPVAVFDALWRDRTTVEIAAQPVAAVGLLGATLVMGLHSLRHPDYHRNSAELGRLIAFWQEPGRDLDGLVALAEETGATAALEPFFSRLGRRVVVPQDRATQDALAEFRLRGEVGDLRGIGWVLTLARTPVWRWPGVVRRSLVTLTESAERDYGLDSGDTGLWAARWRRMRRVLRDLPELVRVVMTNRRGIRVVNARRRSGPPQGR